MLVFRLCVFALSALAVGLMGGCQGVWQTGPGRARFVDDDGGGLRVREETFMAGLAVSEQADQQGVRVSTELFDVAEAVALDDLERLAFEHNPTLRAAAARSEIARGRAYQAGLFPNPMIGYHGTELGDHGKSGGQGGFIRQQFVTAGKLRLERAIAEREVEESEFRLLAQERRVLTDVHLRFYECLVAQRREVLSRDLVRLAEDLAAATRRLVDARQSAENSLLQAEIEVEQARIRFDNATEQRAEAWRRLAAVVGINTVTVPELTGQLEGNLPQLDWEDALALVIAGHSELSAARLRVERMRLAIVQAHKQNVPDVDVLVSVRHANVSSDDIANVEVGFPIPIFDQNRGNIRAAHAELVEAVQDARRIELQLQDQLAVVYRRFQNASRQVARYANQIVPRAQRSLDLVTAGYERGQVDYLTLITAQRTFVGVSLEQLDALAELYQAATTIQGQLLSGSLLEQS